MSTTNLNDLLMPSHRIAGPGAVRDTIRYVGTHAMTLDEFVEIPDNPIQRDTAARAGNARRLDVFAETHRRVVVARMPSGKLVKVDGHTRAYRWAEGSVKGMPAPGSRFIVADIYTCADDDDLRRLYTHYDSKEAADTTSDALYGACRDLGLTFGSPMMKRMGFAYAIKWLHRRLYGYARGDEFGSVEFAYRAAKTFRRSLRLLDTIAPDTRKFPAVWTAAALATMERDGMKAVYFWDAYNRGSGMQNGQEKDGLIAVKNLLDYKRSHKEMGGKDMMANFGRLLNGYEKWHRKQMYTREYPEPKSDAAIEAFLAQVREAIELNQ